MIDSHEVAVVLNSAARLLQAEAAAISGPEPAPVYIIAELISGGRAAKFENHLSSVPFVRVRLVFEYDAWTAA